MSPGRARAMLAAVLGALALLVPVALALPAQAATSQVAVVQALSGPPVDVTVAGRVLTGLAAGTVHEAGALPAGSHPVEVRRGGAVLVSDSVTVHEGSATSLVVHAASTANGPRVAVGLSDAPTDAPPPGSGRMAVLYVGASGPVDVRVDGAKAGPLSGLDTGGGAQGDMTPGSHRVAATRAGSEEVLLAPQQVSLAAGVTTNVYVFGGVEGGPLSLTTQVFGQGSSSGAPAGGPAAQQAAGPDPGPTLRGGSDGAGGSGGPSAGSDGPDRPGGPDGAGSSGGSVPGTGAGADGDVQVLLPEGTTLVSLKSGRSPFERWAAAPPGAELPGAELPDGANPSADSRGGTAAPAWLALALLLAAAATTWTLRRRRAGTGPTAAP